MKIVELTTPFRPNPAQARRQGDHRRQQGILLSTWCRWVLQWKRSYDQLRGQNRATDSKHVNNISPSTLDLTMANRIRVGDLYGQEINPRMDFGQGQ